MVFIVPIAQFYLTDVGKAAALDAEANSIDIQITHLAVGTAKYDGQAAAPAKTSLTTEIARYGVAGGGVNGQVLRLLAIFTPDITANVFEVGLFLADGTLFAIAAVTGVDPLLLLANGLTNVVTHGVSLADIGSNITVSVDANSPLAVSLISQHIAHGDPHTQYLLKTDFNAGVIALQYADNVLQQNINTEEANRISSDNLLNNKIDYEINQREAADDALQFNIDNERTSREHDDGVLSDRVTILENAPPQDLSGKYDKTGGQISGPVQIDGTLVLNQSGNTQIYHMLHQLLHYTDRDQFWFNKPLYWGGFVMSENGYTALPNGHILQWGRHDRLNNGGEDNVEITFPITFPNYCYGAVATRLTADPSGDNSDAGLSIYGYTPTQLSVHLSTFYGGANGSSRGFTYFAIGR